jgi:uncharacterized protein
MKTAPEKSGDPVVVLGASDRPDRYSNRAVRLLMREGYRVIPVHRSLRKIEGLEVTHSLAEIHESVGTLTVYISPAGSEPLAADMLRLKPRRVIFNPGAESARLEDELRGAGVEVLNACTLVMLNGGIF